MRTFLFALLLGLSATTSAAIAADPPTLKQYFDATGHPDAWQGGVRIIPIHTPAGLPRAT